MNHLRQKSLYVAITFMLGQSAFAETEVLNEVVVNDHAFNEFGSNRVNASVLAQKRTQTNDTASLLGDIAGLNTISTGGVSGLPVIHGLNDDRVKVDVDGMGITSACANHMNSPLSYIAPANVENITAYSGGTVPVSVGGDSIAGTIKVESARPQFSKVGEKPSTSGSLTVGGQSNGNDVNGAANVTYRDETTSLTYSKTYAHSDDYKAASSFKAGDNKLTNTVGTSLYEIHTDKVTLAKKVGADIYQFSIGKQYIPYQGYPSQYMDMTHNESLLFNASYLGTFNWGALDARVFQQKTEHSMNFIDTKFNPTAMPGPIGMPMNTSGKDMGYIVKGSITMDDRNTLTVGNEYHHQELDDWWSANPSTAMMSPNSYWNINGGWRNRFGTFAELETKQSAKWTTLAGIRHEQVTSGTGNVVGYYGTLGGGISTTTGGEYAVDKNAADAFNAQNHNHTDQNIDVTLAAKYLADNTSDYEFGYARKTRSPNLYELYTWGKSAMDMKMIGWNGDGNGYVGNLNLKPEVANTLSVTGNWHDAASEDWQVKATPYASYVENYIDADRCGSVAVGNGAALCNGATPAAAGSGNIIGLQYSNHNAMFYGLDLSTKKALGQLSSGNYTLLTQVSYVQGTILDTNANHPSNNIYNLMPLNTKVALQHQLGKWNNAIELQVVASKTAVDTTRNEFTTPDYKLVNLRTGYDWGQYRVDAGITNLFDEMYYLPTGGAMLAPSVQNAGGTGKAPYGAVPGMGRSLYVAGTLLF